MYILYWRVAQHTESVISEAGSFFFFFLSRGQQLAWWSRPPAEGVFLREPSLPLLEERGRVAASGS